ncbi:MAG: hypothetical protein AB7F59_00030 [Bdellovibrionales bacterium]
MKISFGLLTFVIIFGLFSSQIALAQKSSKKGNRDDRGLSAQVDLGLPTVTIENPDSSIAYYTGIGVTGRGILPLLDTRYFSFNLVGNAKYLDLKNTASTASQKEIANHIGAGGGVSVMLWIFFYGIDYNYMLARHYTVGTFSQELNYNYTSAVTYYGAQIEFGQLSLGGGVSMNTATISNGATDLNMDSPYSEKTYFVFARYSTGLTVPRMFKALFSDGKK